MSDIENDARLAELREKLKDQPPGGLGNLMLNIELRDMLAAACLAGPMMTVYIEQLARQKKEKIEPIELAHACYTIADAMLEKRKDPRPCK